MRAPGDGEAEKWKKLWEPLATGWMDDLELKWTDEAAKIELCEMPVLFYENTKIFDHKGKKSGVCYKI